MPPLEGVRDACPPRAMPPQPPNPPQPQASNNMPPAVQTASMATLRMAPRMGAEPVTLKVKPGEQRVWNIIGMDLEGLNTDSLVLHYDSSAMDVSEVVFGGAMKIDPRTPPVATINRDTGTIKIVSSDGKPLQFLSGGDVIGLRLRGGKSGETSLVIEPPELRDTAGTNVMTAVTGGRAQVE